MQDHSLKLARLPGLPRIAMIRSATSNLAPSAASLWYAGDQVQAFRSARECCEREGPL